MSATNRGAERVAADFYPTPAWCVDRLLDEIGWVAGAVLEPAVGDGAIVRAVDGWNRANHGDTNRDPWAFWTTVDIRPEAGADITGDFVAPLFPVLPDTARYTWAITNPPFTLAFDFAQECIRRADRVALLLRLNWLASERRAAWLRENTPSVYVLPNRPSFTGDGATDAADYAWMVWGLHPERQITILGTTPEGQR